MESGTAVQYIHYPCFSVPQMMKSLLCVLLLSVVCLVSSADDENARLLASKNILNEILVEGRDLTVQYTIYNVGGRYVHGTLMFEVHHLQRGVQVCARGINV